MKTSKTKNKSLASALFSKPKPSALPITLLAPTAKQVAVAGTFNEWQPALPLKLSPDGKWHGELKLMPGRYEYLFVVDGQWIPDPAAPEVVPNPFGGLNSVLSVG